MQETLLPRLTHVIPECAAVSLVLVYYVKSLLQQELELREALDYRYGTVQYDTMERKHSPPCLVHRPRGSPPHTINRSMNRSVF